MRLVGYDDYVAAIGQERIVGLAIFWRELLNCRENHAAGRPIKQLPQLVAVLAPVAGSAAAGPCTWLKVPKSWSSRSFRSVSMTKVGFSIAGCLMTCPA